MKKIIGLTLTVLFAIIFMPSLVSAGDYAVDQQASTNCSYKYTSNIDQYQTFVPGQSTLSKIDIYMADTNGMTVTLKIIAPSGKVKTTFAKATENTAEKHWESFVLPSAITVATGDLYKIQLEAAEFFTWVISNDDPYAPGIFSSWAATWWDGCFKTYWYDESATPAAPPSDPATGDTSTSATSTGGSNSSSSLQSVSNSGKTVTPAATPAATAQTAATTEGTAQPSAIQAAAEVKTPWYKNIWTWNIAGIILIIAGINVLWFLRLKRASKKEAAK